MIGYSLIMKEMMESLMKANEELIGLLNMRHCMPYSITLFSCFSRIYTILKSLVDDLLSPLFQLLFIFHQLCSNQNKKLSKKQINAPPQSIQSIESGVESAASAGMHQKALNLFLKADSNLNQIESFDQIEGFDKINSLQLLFTSNLSLHLSDQSFSSSSFPLFENQNKNVIYKIPSKTIPSQSLAPPITPIIPINKEEKRKSLSEIIKNTQIENKILLKSDNSPPFTPSSKKEKTKMESTDIKEKLKSKRKRKTKDSIKMIKKNEILKKLKKDLPQTKNPPIKTNQTNSNTNTKNKNQNNQANDIFKQLLGI